MCFSSRTLTRTWCVVFLFLVLGVIAVDVASAGVGGDKGTVPTRVPRELDDDCPSPPPPPGG